MQDTSSADVTLHGQPIQGFAPEPIHLPLVSIVVRNWNYAEYIGAAIDSVRAQDYPRLECIVVENGSTDNSREVIDRHVGDDPRFRVVDTGENLGPMGGVLRGLDLARGEFVVFVDSDDYIFPNFASTHIQTHLALPRNVAFTSSNTIEIDAFGTMLAGGRSTLARQWPADRYGLRSAQFVPRLKTVTCDDYARLHNCVILCEPNDREWLWNPGTSNMFRRFVLDIVRPRSTPEALALMAADGHFCNLSHIIGGSALIGEPLSARRIHDRNHFATSPTVYGLRVGGGIAVAHMPVRRQERARVILEQLEEFHRRIGDRIWTALDRMLESDGGNLRTEYSLPEIRKLLAQNLKKLFEIFGASTTFRHLRDRMKYRTLREVVAEAYGDQIPPKLNWRLRRLECMRALTKREHSNRPMA